MVSLKMCQTHVKQTADKVIKTVIKKHLVQMGGKMESEVLKVLYPLYFSGGGWLQDQVLILYFIRFSSTPVIS